MSKVIFAKISSFVLLYLRQDVGESEICLQTHYHFAGEGCSCFHAGHLLSLKTLGLLRVFYTICVYRLTRIPR
jgi:hypothetical protein